MHTPFNLAISRRSYLPWLALKAPGSIVLFRHALAPGGGDPAGFVAGDCSTQRNLSEEDRKQAKRLSGTRFARGARIQFIFH